jgi:serine/threonine protein phosphatase 1
MAKLFVVSDIHSFYDEMKEALDNAGFDPKNEEHWLLSLGDALDRGPKTQETIDYLMGLDRCILIKGNHDQLIMDLLDRKFPYDVDHHNGTFRSVIDLAPNAKNFYDACMVAYDKVKPFVDRMVNYVETDRFVFCHSWIPVNCDDDLPYYYRRNRKFSKKEDWRTAHQSEWDRSMWMNPLEMAMSGFGIEKCIVAGHWHCSAGWAIQLGVSEFGDDAIFDPFNYEDEIVMIDACTAHSHKVNCLVLEDNFIYGTS